jgi:hypothetical protein
MLGLHSIVQIGQAAGAHQIRLDVAWHGGGQPLPDLIQFVPGGVMGIG